MLRRARIMTMAFLLAWSATAHSSNIVFSDDFESGPDSNWIVTHGEWDWVDGRWYYGGGDCSEYGCDGTVIIGRSDWTDVAMSFQFTAETSGPTQAFICLSEPQAPADGTSEGYSMNFAANGLCLNLAYWQNGIGAPIPYPPGGFCFGSSWMHAGVTYEVHLRKTGDHLWGSITALNTEWPQHDYYGLMDPRRNTGFVGFNPMGVRGYLDNFVVYGTGVVAVENHSWGKVKSLFR